MTELDFNTDTNEILDYIVDKIFLAESGDESAMSYLEYLWGTDEAMLKTAYAEYYKQVDDMLSYNYEQ